MEKFTLYIEYTSFEELSRKLERLISLQGFKALELHIIFKRAISGKELARITKIERSLSLRADIIFINLATVKFCKGLRRFIKRLYSKGFCLELYLNDETAPLLGKKGFKKRLNSRLGSYKLFIEKGENPEEQYRKYSKIGLPLNFQSPDYSTDLRDWFDRWATCKGALPVNIFDQILRVLLLSDNTHNCSFNSCLGKSLYISADSVYSFCPKNPKETALVLSDIDEATSFADIFNDERFISLLESSLKRRVECLAGCQDFAYCQGGCPLQRTEECSNKNYILLVSHIRNFIDNALRNNDISGYNYSIKEAIYTAISFNSSFGTLQIEGRNR